jgi:hypothetical protein
MSLRRIKQDYERIAENFSNSASQYLCSCYCRYLELSDLQITDNEEMSDEKRVIFNSNSRCCDDPTNAQIGFRFIEVCEVESDISDFEFEN